EQPGEPGDQGGVTPTDQGKGTSTEEMNHLPYTGFKASAGSTIAIAVSSAIAGSSLLASSKRKRKEDE
ncbi:LPXTG cell wall anchor domain-containing protein, partial [Aerococcus urinaeequi]|uniref:LPXTG cell wall anchor domain-containing protein n=1 Tax=Aerococcus urinaeequi TaxID=51665 RepID=UPI003D6B007C